MWFFNVVNFSQSNTLCSRVFFDLLNYFFVDYVLIISRLSKENRYCESIICYFDDVVTHQKDIWSSHSSIFKKLMKWITFFEKTNIKKGLIWNQIAKVDICWSLRAKLLISFSTIYFFLLQFWKQVPRKLSVSFLGKFRSLITVFQIIFSILSR